MSEDTQNNGGYTTQAVGQRVPESYPELLAIHSRQLEAQIKTQLWMLTALVEHSNLSDEFRREMLKQSLYLTNLFYTGDDKP